MRRERLVLTLPPDPAYARLTRLTTSHFLRQHGLAVHEAQRDARRVESRMRGALRSAGRADGRSVIALVLTSDAHAVEVSVVRGRTARARLMQVTLAGAGR